MDTCPSVTLSFGIYSIQFFSVIQLEMSHVVSIMYERVGASLKTVFNLHCSCFKDDS